MSALPQWLLKKTPKHFYQKKIRETLQGNDIHSVCESALCPNRGECFEKKVMTFMILGNACTRACTFCAVKKTGLVQIDPAEPQNVVDAVKRLGLKHVVVTSVTRDDLIDGGVSQFIATVRLLQERIGSVSAEVLIPDFLGKSEIWKQLLGQPIAVLNHNLETVPRLYPIVRPQAVYERSLELLRYFRKNSNYKIKSGLMVGLGEQSSEVYKTMDDLRAYGCELVTIGQYLQPSKKNIQVAEYVHPEQFKAYQEYGRSIGLEVFAGPWVRSSYCAEEVYNNINQLQLQKEYSR